MFKKITEDMDLKSLDFNDENLADVVNGFIKQEIKSYIFETNMSILECESPIEQLFALCFAKYRNKHYWITKFFKNNLDVFQIENQIEIGIYRVDFLITITDLEDNFLKRFVIEIDGHDFHEKTKEQAKRDKEKDRFLTSEGYIVVRFTGSEIYNDYNQKIKEFLALIIKVCGGE